MNALSTDLIALVLGMLLVAAVASFSLLPLVLHSRSDQAEVAPAEQSHTERQRLYSQVLELEFDHQTGKLSAADYDTLSADLLARAASLLRAGDESATDVEDTLEQEIAAARRARARRKPVRLVTVSRRATS
jgi:hypothetical protein